MTYRSRLTPTSSGARVRLTERDLAWFAAIHRHGALPASYLHAFTAHMHRDRSCTKRRLTNLFHESDTTHGGPYLSRPPQQTRTIDARYQEAVYDLTPASQMALGERDLTTGKAAPTSTVHWWHDLYTNCISASFELECLKSDRYSFMAHGALAERLGHDFRFQVAGRQLIPDRVFALRNNQTRKARICFLEMDCATEPIRSTQSGRKTIARTIQQYRKLIGSGAYRRELKTQMSALALTVATSRMRMEQMIKEVAAQASCGANSYMLFRTLEISGFSLKPLNPIPKRTLGSWYLAGLAPVFILK